MQQQDFTTTFLFDQSPSAVFNAINDIPAWWSQDFTGTSQKEGDEFTVNFSGMHTSTQKLIEVVPDQKVVWLVTNSNLTFLTNKSEWDGTKVIFDISENGDQTQLKFTHQGLVPQIECFKDCSKGWNYYLQQSLVPFIKEGKGNPELSN